MEPITAALNLRDARPNEIEEVSQLLVLAYQQYQKFLSPERWDWYRSNIVDVKGRMADSDLIVAEMKNKIVGTVTLYTHGPDQGWPEGWAGIRLLAVHPDYRGHGIGRALMEECLSRCRISGKQTIGLHTTELMEVARAMYERMGFRRAPEFDFHPDPESVVFAYRLDL